MGGRQIVLVLTTGFSVLNTRIFWRETKTKRLFSQCIEQRITVVDKTQVRLLLQLPPKLSLPRGDKAGSVARHIQQLWKWQQGRQRDDRTAKTLCQKFETNIPRNETACLVPSSYIHVSVSNLYCTVYAHDQSAYFAAAKYVD
jgi:hypothetical protein